MEKPSNRKKVNLFHLMRFLQTDVSSVKAYCAKARQNTKI